MNRAKCSIRKVLTRWCHAEATWNDFNDRYWGDAAAKTTKRISLTIYSRTKKEAFRLLRVGLKAFGLKPSWKSQ